jgi:outer membrane PBP1 activator LpoA protein
LTGVTIVPTGEWGARVAAAFADELKILGGSVLDSQRYEPAQADFAEEIKTVMQVRPAKLDHKLDKGEKPDPPTHRADATFIFVASSSPGPARLILPQLKFYYCGDVPVYSTSDSFAPDPAANGELDGLYFPDMPWMVSNDPATAQIRDSVRAAWPANTARRDRLYAFGFDAYRLVPALRGSLPTQANEVMGVTGRLYVDANNRIRRDLDWAQIKNGSPNEL